MRVNFQSLIFKISCFLISTLFVFLLNNQSVYADFANLTPCKESPAFEKRLNSEVKKLENRLKFYTPESKEAKFLIHEVEATKNRFDRYGNSNLLCGKEGLPRIIASGQWNHANEFVIPGLLFLYITGWIGWVGRKYITYAAKTDDAFESEIIINVPVAISIITSGFLWPIESWNELKNGKLVAAEEDVTVSPR
jgi:photosystem I subunit 3